MSDSYGCLVVGLSNKDITGESWYSTSINASSMPVFVVGNGDIDSNGNSTLRSDALMVLKNGNVGVGVHPTEKLEVDGNALVGGNIYERFTITDVTTNAHTLSDTDRIIFYKFDGDGTLTIPSGLSNKVWEIVNTDDGLASTKTFDINPGSGVTLSVVKSYQNNQSEILRGYTGKLIRTSTNGYTLIKY